MRKVLGLMITVALLASWSDVGAAASSTITILGDEKFIPNALVSASFRFDPYVLSVASGTTITLDNRGSWDANDEPHTLSIVNAADLPDSFDDLFNCAICAQVFAHGINNDGGDGINAVLDSVLVGPQQAITATITAPSGSLLDYFCAFHPWMQGKISVR